MPPKQPDFWSTTLPESTTPPQDDDPPSTAERRSIQTSSALLHTEYHLDNPSSTIPQSQGSPAPREAPLPLPSDDEDDQGDVELAPLPQFNRSKSGRTRPHVRSPQKARTETSPLGSEAVGKPSEGEGSSGPQSPSRPKRTDSGKVRRTSSQRRSSTSSKGSSEPGSPRSQLRRTQSIGQAENDSRTGTGAGVARDVPRSPRPGGSTVQGTPTRPVRRSSSVSSRFRGFMPFGTIRERSDSVFSSGSESTSVANSPVSQTVELQAVPPTRGAAIYGRVPLHRTASRLSARSNGTFADAAGFINFPDVSMVDVRCVPVSVYKDATGSRIQTEEAGASSSSSGAEAPGQLVAFHKGQEGQDDLEYPDGGWEAWLCLVGGVCASFGAFGLAASVGAFQSYYRENLLSTYSPSTVAWIGSTQAGLCFGLCLFTGPLFDRYGPRPLLLAGTLMLVLAFIFLSLSTQFYQIFLCHATLMACGMCMMFIVPLGALGQWFFLRRGLAFGILMMGASVGAIIWPSIIAHLPQKIGFGWTTRVMGLMLGVLGLIASFLVKTRHPGGCGRQTSFFHFSEFKNPAYACVALSFPLQAYGLFSFLTFITTYGRLVGLGAFAPNLLMLMNASAALGRLFFGTMADRAGILNVAFTGIVGMAILSFAWIGIKNQGGLIALCLIYGFLSGAPISLQGPMITETCSDVTLAGSLMGQALMVQSIAQLTGPPIFGAIIGSGSDSQQLRNFPHAIVFASCSLCACGALLLCARFLVSRKVIDKV